MRQRALSSKMPTCVLRCPKVNPEMAAPSHCKDGKDKDGKDCKDWKNGNNGGY